MSRVARILGLLLVVLAGAPAAAQERWERNKGDCEKVFRGWRTAALHRLRDCVMKWEMYRDVTRVDADDRAIAQEAFDKLYLEGTERDAVMALSALKRLGLRPSRLRSESVAVPRPDDGGGEVRIISPTPEVAPAPVVAEPEAPAAEPRPIDPHKAKAHALKGRDFLRQGKLPEAVSELLIAADADPTFAEPLYLAADAMVKLGQPRPAIEYLARMKAINSDTSRRLIRRAATDPRFAPLRNIPAFKDLTGTAVIQLLNGAGEAGKDVVLEWKRRLEKAHMPVADVGVDINPRTATFIYTKPGYEQHAEDVHRILQLGLVHREQIDWISKYDVIVVYGAQTKEEWVDDEAEKAGEEAKAKKKAEEAAKKAEEERKKKEQEEMRKKLEMLKMLQEMESADPAGAAEPAAPELP